MLRAMIVDDEAPARSELRFLLEQTGKIGTITEASSVRSAIEMLMESRVDVVFLDIQMPRISGLEMIGMIEPTVLPQIVFVTAFDEHALKAFEEHATDYLLKPIEPERLAKTLNWLRSGIRPKIGNFPPPETRVNQIPCTSRNRICLIGLNEVEVVFTDQSGVHVVGQEKNGVTELTLKLLQERTSLVRCHRQYLINLEKVTEIELLDNGSADAITSSGKRVPVSRRHFREIKNHLLIP